MHLLHSAKMQCNLAVRSDLIECQTPCIKWLATSFSSSLVNLALNDAIPVFMPFDRSYRNCRRDEKKRCVAFDLGGLCGEFLADFAVSFWRTLRRVFGGLYGEYPLKIRRKVRHKSHRKVRPNLSAKAARAEFFGCVSLPAGFAEL